MAGKLYELAVLAIRETISLLCDGFVSAHDERRDGRRLRMICRESVSGNRSETWG
jgi:hypothetical protein